MQILALDTASPFPSVTLLVREELREEPFPQDRRASEELLPAIERCLAAAGTTLARCNRIAVCSGPGSFTGLRIGLATAWALGRAAGVPVETVSTLEALAGAPVLRHLGRLVDG
jgi:tRNA threonylcarbamoyladenosine biosynthesis protein TsaB